MNSVELREKRQGLVVEARELDKKAKAEDRDLTNEESEQFDRIMGEVDRMKVKIDRMEKLETAEGDLNAPEPRASKPLDGKARTKGEPAEDQRKAKADYRHWLRTGEVRGAFRSEQSRHAETRDTIIGTDAKGGYLITPTQISTDIVKLINDSVFVRKLATVTQVTEAKKLGIRKMTTRMSDANWTTEVVAATEDTTMAFDRRNLEPYLLTKLAKVSLRTLALSTDAEKEVNDELGYKFSITEEKGFLTGTGSSQPLGVFVASASGISTGRDVAAAGSTAIAADDLINVKFGMKQGHLADEKAGWIMHRDVVKAIRKLKDSQNQYLWQAGLQSGAADRILDVPYYMSEYAPNTFTTGLYLAVLGNFRYYRIAEVVHMFIQRLVERYADTNEVGFIARRWVDGAPVLEEAFTRLKLA